MRTKKIISLLLSVMLILGITAVLSISAYADDEDGYYVSGDFEYTLLDDGTAEITDYLGDAIELVIPSELDGYTVTSLSLWQFEATDSLVSLEVPDSVIHSVAFYYCSNLKKVSIGSGLERIWGSDFDGLDSLEEIVISDDNKKYSSQDGILFNKDKTELIKYPVAIKATSYSIPEGVKIIGDYAFDGCSNLANVEFSNSLSEIGQAAFQYCTSLKSITLPENVDKVSVWAFYGCENLAEINLPESYTAIDGYATFDDTAYSNNKSNWEDGNLYIGEYLIHGSRDEEFYGAPYDYNGTVTIKEGTKYICPYAFSQYYSFAFNDSIEKIIVPDSVTHIGNAAFGILHNLKTIELGSGVEYLGDGWVNSGFFDAKWTPESINVSEQNKTFSSIDGVLYNKDKTELLLWPAGKDIEAFVAPNTLKTFRGSLFSWQSGPNTIVIPSSVEKISGFSCCYGVYNIYILNPQCDVSEMDYGLGESNNPGSTTIYGYTNSTAQANAEEHGNNFVAIDELKDSIIADGTDEVYIIGSENGASVHCTYPLDEFISVTVNGQLVDEANYTLAEGSTILTFTSEYLDTLPASENVVALNFVSGTVYTILTVKNPVIEDSETEIPTDSSVDGSTTEAPKDELTPDETSAQDKTNNEISVKSPSTGAAEKGLFALAAIALAGGAVVIAKKKEQD